MNRKEVSVIPLPEHVVPPFVAIIRKEDQYEVAKARAEISYLVAKKIHPTVSAISLILR